MAPIQHLVSTGKGRTTCGYFLADNKHIIYASTHAAGDACPTPPDRSHGYVWGVFAGLRHLPGHRRRQDRQEAYRYARLRRRGDRQLEDRHDRLHFAGFRRPGPVDHAASMARTKSRSPQKWATMAARCSRAMAASWYGAPTIPRRPKTWRATKTLLADNLTAPMKMEIVVSDADGSERAHHHRFRMRQLRSHLHAGWQEDSVRLQQARLRHAAASSCI